MMATGAQEEVVALLMWQEQVGIGGNAERVQFQLDFLTQQ